MKKASVVRVDTSNFLDVYRALTTLSSIDDTPTTSLRYCKKVL